MVNPGTAWDLVRENAIKALRADIEWYSLKNKSRYKVQEVTDDRLKILRLERNTIEELTASRIIQAVKYLNDHRGRVARGQLISPTVAEETALVLFHPYIKWDESGDYIIENDQTEITSEDKEWRYFSAHRFLQGYGPDEPEYTMADVTEPNPDYKPWKEK